MATILIKICIYGYLRLLVALIKKTTEGKKQCSLTFKKLHLDLLAAVYYSDLENVSNLLI